MAIVVFWLLARALTSSLVATLASLLLLANLAQIWFARVPTTEIMAQAFTLSGVYFAVCCYRRPDATRGVLLCGAAFGLAAFVRIDMLMFVTPLVVGFLALVAVERRWARPWTWCALVLLVLTAHAIAHALLVSTPYTERIMFHALQGRSVTAASRLAAATGAGRRRARAAAVAPLPAIQVASRVAPLIFLAILAGAVYRIWPQVTGGFLVMLVSPARLRPGVGGGRHLVRRRSVGAHPARGRAAS